MKSNCSVPLLFKEGLGVVKIVGVVRTPRVVGGGYDFEERVFSETFIIRGLSAG